MLKGDKVIRDQSDPLDVQVLKTEQCDLPVSLEQAEAWLVTRCPGLLPPSMQKAPVGSSPLLPTLHPPSTRLLSCPVLHRVGSGSMSYLSCCHLHASHWNEKIPHFWNSDPGYCLRLAKSWCQGESWHVTLSQADLILTGWPVRF